MSQIIHILELIREFVPYFWRVAESIWASYRAIWARFRSTVPWVWYSSFRRIKIRSRFCFIPMLIVSFYKVFNSLFVGLIFESSTSHSETIISVAFLSQVRFRFQYRGSHYDAVSRIVGFIFTSIYKTSCNLLIHSKLYKVFYFAIGIARRIVIYWL